MNVDYPHNQKPIDAITPISAVLERVGSQDEVVHLERPDWTVGMERVCRIPVVGAALILLNGPPAVRQVNPRWAAR